MNLSTCGVCGATIERWAMGWTHIAEPIRWHAPEPDDSHVSGPDDEAERALDDDADAYFDRCRD